MEQPVVSVCVITYNQKAYIKQCLDNIINQQTNFNFEIVIGEDCSTDGTASIIQDYLEESSAINFLDNSKNLGVIPNFIRTLKACKGKYIAFCEGDDYWVDENKLQKQVDFLDNNFEYGGVCGEIISRDVEQKIDKKHIFEKEGSIDFENIVFKNKIHSNTILFRSELLDIEALKAINLISIGDWYLHLLITKQKPYYYIPQYFALYRVHNAGIFSKKSDFYKSYQKSKLLYAYLNCETNNEYSGLVKKSLLKQILRAFNSSSKENKDELKKLFKIMQKEKIFKLNRSTIRGAMNIIK